MIPNFLGISQRIYLLSDFDEKKNVQEVEEWTLCWHYKAVRAPL